MNDWTIKPAIALALAASSLLGVGAAGFASAAPGLARASYVPVGGPASVPYGWADFCRRYAGECDGGPLAPQDVNLTPQAMKEIERVDKWVNAHVKPVSHMEHWGVIDQWDYPADGKGDCEDYALFKRKILIDEGFPRQALLMTVVALFKRKILIDEGFPRQALLMTVVKDEHNEGHAILTVKTSAGEFVIDNLNDEIKSWDRTGYRFVKRQSQTDQNVWLQIGNPTAAPDYVAR
ncbi:MAG: transglutaminase [Hyphomicrobiales bacterium]|nr:MAG: transglutaminase [Hyphomicrobiales bacterium]